MLLGKADNLVGSMRFELMTSRVSVGRSISELRAYTKEQCRNRGGRLPCNLWSLTRWPLLALRETEPFVSDGIPITARVPLWPSLRDGSSGT